MRAVGLFGHQPITAVEAADRCNARRRRRRRPKRERPAHAVALHTGLPVFVGLRLGIEKGEIGRRVAVDTVVAHRAAMSEQPVALFGIVEIERSSDHRRTRGTVERVGHQHDMALPSQAPTHVAESRTQAQNVGPDEDSRRSPLTFRIEQNSVAGPIGGLHLDVLFDDARLRMRRACNGRCRNGDRAEGTPRESLILNQTRVNKFVAHGLPPAAVLLWSKNFRSKSKGAYLRVVKLHEQGWCAQNIAIGLAGDPVALGSASGLTINMNSQRRREAAASLNASRSARSSTWIPRIAWTKL